MVKHRSPKPRLQVRVLLGPPLFPFLLFFFLAHKNKFINKLAGFTDNGQKQPKGDSDDTEKKFNQGLFLNFLMLGVFMAPTTILFKFNLTFHQFAILAAPIVNSLASRAGESD